MRPRAFSCLLASSCSRALACICARGCAGANVLPVCARTHVCARARGGFRGCDRICTRVREKVCPSAVRERKECRYASHSWRMCDSARARARWRLRTPARALLAAVRAGPCSWVLPVPRFVASQSTGGALEGRKGVQMSRGTMIRLRAVRSDTSCCKEGSERRAEQARS